jgi:hypothetical protein
MSEDHQAKRAGRAETHRYSAAEDRSDHEQSCDLARGYVRSGVA